VSSAWGRGSSDVSASLQTAMALTHQITEQYSMLYVSEDAYRRDSRLLRQAQQFKLKALQLCAAERTVHRTLYLLVSVML